MLPAIDFEGKIILETPDTISLSPNGNGAIFDSIKKNSTVLNTLKDCDYV